MSRQRSESVGLREMPNWEGIVDGFIDRGDPETSRRMGRQFKRGNPESVERLPERWNENNQEDEELRNVLSVRASETETSVKPMSISRVLETPEHEFSSESESWVPRGRSRQRHRAEYSERPEVQPEQMTPRRNHARRVEAPVTAEPVETQEPMY